MSFNFAVKGTREECIQELNNSSHHELSADAQVARGLVLAFLVDAPASASTLTPVRYEIAGNGHRDPHRSGPPYLTLSMRVVAQQSQSHDLGRHVAADDSELDVDLTGT